MDETPTRVYISRMKNQAPWLGKVFDEPRVGFVAEHGSQWHPLAKPPEPAPMPPEPVPSPLDKIIDEERIGFAGTQRRSHKAQDL
ncbi:MAG: hypothetical protein ABW151_16435 [Pseudorhodoplanes sp.]